MTSQSNWTSQAQILFTCFLEPRRWLSRSWQKGNIRLTFFRLYLSWNELYLQYNILLRTIWEKASWKGKWCILQFFPRNSNQVLAVQYVYIRYQSALILGFWRHIHKYVVAVCLHHINSIQTQEWPQTKYNRLVFLALFTCCGPLFPDF